MLKSQDTKTETRFVMEVLEAGKRQEQACVAIYNVCTKCEKRKKEENSF